MAKLEDVFALEAERENPATWNKIHLYKIGDFWRALFGEGEFAEIIEYDTDMRKGWLMA